MIFNPTTPSGVKGKYMRRWVGPFRIQQVTGPLSYIVTSMNGNKTYRVHASHVRRIHKPLGVQLPSVSPQAPLPTIRNNDTNNVPLMESTLIQQVPSQRPNSESQESSSLQTSADEPPVARRSRRTASRPSYLKDYVEEDS